MLKFVSRFSHDGSGATATEYAILAALIAAVIAAAVGTVGSRTLNLYQRAGGIFG